MLFSQRFVLSTAANTQISTYSQFYLCKTSFRNCSFGQPADTDSGP